MQVNKYHNSISEPAARKAFAKSSEQDELTKTVHGIVENETRRLLETAFKFMRSAKRQELSFEDVESALKYMGIRDIKLAYRESPSAGDAGSDPVIRDTESFLESEMRSIANIQFKPSLSGRWVYINGKVPRTEENIHIRRYKQIREQDQREEDNNKFSIIKDQPHSMLTAEEDEFYSCITSELSSGRVPALEGSNPNNIFPFIIAYLLQSEIRDNKIAFLIQLLHNKNTHLVVEHHLHQILALLQNYSGKLMWEVGLQVATILSCWGSKYKNIYEELIKPAETYPLRIRRLAMMTYFKLPIEVETDSLQKDIAQGVPYALEYQQRLNACSCRLREPMAHSELLAEGLAGLETDPFLSTML